MLSASGTRSLGFGTVPLGSQSSELSFTIINVGQQHPLMLA